MYYRDADLRTVDPGTGKRLWFSNEIQIIIHPTSGEREYRSLAGPRADEEFQKSVFDEHVSKIVNDAGTAVGLSKAAFVTAILDKPELSAAFDRNAFRAIFEVIREIVAARPTAAPPAPG
jgi:hypothetical protein